MFKYISVFVCLMGVSLATDVSVLKGSISSKALSMLETVQKHREYLGTCADILGEEVKSCSDVIDDLAALEVDVTGSASKAAVLYEQGLKIFAEFSSCSTQSIFKQITCYKAVITSAEALISSLKELAADVQEELESDISQLKIDLQTCVGSGYTSHTLNTKIAFCKLRSMLKN